MKNYILRGLAFLLLILGLGGVAQSVQAQAPDRPVNSTVLDPLGYLTSETIAEIDGENRTWESTTDQLQVGVYILDNLPSDIESLANATFRKWQIGFSGTNNGVLLLIAVEDREFRIETSDNAATVLTDVEARRILDNSREFFRAENYDEGVLYIVDAIGDTFYSTNRGQARLADFVEQTQADSGESLIVLFQTIFFFAIVIWVFLGGGGRGGGGTGRALLWALLSSPSSSDFGSSSFGSSGRSSGGSSGGWSGGGGGGGGASSGW